MMETESFSALFVVWLWPVPWLCLILSLVLSLFKLKRSAATIASVGLAVSVVEALALVNLVWSDDPPSEGALWPTLRLVLIPMAALVVTLLWLRARLAKE